MNALPPRIAQALDTDLLARHSLAWLRVDAALELAGTGGCLEHYGLAALDVGKAASIQLVFLEGLFPLDESPLLIRSLELPGGRVVDLHCHAHDGETWILLLDVTAERDESRLVQQKAYEMTLLREKEAELNRRLAAANAALLAAQREIEASRAALQQAHDRLDQGLQEAAAYVRSILPRPLSEPFDVDWRFLPSARLGGDCFGYHWIDDEHFALYLLDVCGHGIGPSLLSIGVLQTLRGGSLAGADPREPGQVCAALNRVYRMEDHYDLFFTLWYGVYSRVGRRLVYASAGHPPALLVPVDARDMQQLATRGAPIGTVRDASWRSETVALPPGSRLYLLSDGAFEIARPDGTMLSLDEFAGFVGRLDAGGHDTGGHDAHLDRLLDFVHRQAGAQTLEDDLSIVRFVF